MKNIIVSNGDFSICEKPGYKYTDLVIEADSKCNLPTKVFHTNKQANKALRMTGFNKWSSPGKLVKVQVV